MTSLLTRRRALLVAGMGSHAASHGLVGTAENKLVTEVVGHDSPEATAARPPR